MQHMRSDTLKNIVQSQLRDVIKAHGPITLPLIGSASKRILGQYNGYLKSLNSECYTSQHVEDIKAINEALKGNEEAWKAWKRIRKEVQP